MQSSDVMQYSNDGLLNVIGKPVEREGIYQAIEQGTVLINGAIYPAIEVVVEPLNELYEECNDGMKFDWYIEEYNEVELSL